MKENSVLDHPFSRVVALFIALALSGMVVVVWWDDFFSETETSTVITNEVNPKLAECLKARVQAVDNMKAEGVITETQYQQFKGRAVSYCESRFSPNR